MPERPGCHERDEDGREKREHEDGWCKHKPLVVDEAAAIPAVTGEEAVEESGKAGKVRLL